LLEELAQEDLRAANVLSLLTRLRKRYPPDLASAALETAQLRQKAKVKFRHASAMFFTADGLQQASGEALATHHAQLLAGYSWIADLGCGIGGDALALGQSASVVGFDRDLLRLNMARQNAAVYGASAAFVQADLKTPLPAFAAAFFDPARRDDEQRRIFSVAEYIPPLSIIQNWRYQALLVKLSPGVNIAELKEFGAGVEFVSENGELKEALLHMGDLQFSGFRATRLPEKETLYAQAYEAPPLADAPRRFLYEPDPAVIRSGLLGEMLASLRLSAFRLDPTIAYLTGDVAIQTPWLRFWQVDDWLPFNLKKLRALLLQNGVGRVTVKKRGSPITPEELQSRLALKKGDHHATIILTRLQGKPIALVSYG